MAFETRPGVPQRGVWGWMFFDWAAQPVFTVLTTFIFGPYVVSRLADDPATGQAAWSYGVAAAGLSVAILSPVLGSIADQSGPKKPWIAGFAAIQIVLTASLWFAAPDSPLLLVVAAFAALTIAAELSAVFNDAMLPHLVRNDDTGIVSNIAWGLGYLGGLIVLFFVIGALAANPETNRTLAGIEPLFGVDVTQGEDARAAGPIAAAWYLIFLLPLFVFTPDVARRSKQAVGRRIANGLQELRGTLADVRRQPGLALFLIARMIYQDGVNALLAIGGAFAAAIFGWSIQEIGIFGILLNLVAIPSCLIAGRLDRRLGSKRLVLGAVTLLAIATLGLCSTGPGFTLFGLVQLGTADGGGFFGTAAEKAYLLFGLLIGVAFGPVQASSRSWMARSIGEEDGGRYFGLYALTGRVTSFIAPLTIAVVTDLTGSQRIGLSVLLVFFVVGLILAVRAPYPAADPAALSRDSAPDALR